ncbi:phage major capsid protein [Shouchella patagoniensis]|uniref:phage major capsid protein n=1 Tax=Shouchella patagoniensis TaxID=228576 RepID=UPI000995543E|nr:phage major capsid protein [Shouchella patagoniensis]
MTKEMRDLLEEIQNKKKEARELANSKKIEEAKAARDEMKDLQARFDILLDVQDDEEGKVLALNKNKQTDTKSDATEAFFKFLRGKDLTEAENAMLTEGDNNEIILIPEDINHQITEYRREFKSARHLVSYYSTNVLAGSFVYEEGKTMLGLASFEDGDEIGYSDEPSFKNKGYKVKDYGALLPISKKLLEVEAGGLMAYLGRMFVRKATITENEAIFKQLIDGKTAKELSDWKSLVQSLNVDIDPAFASSIRIVTNQDGFNHLDLQVDENGRGLLQPNPSLPTQKLFKGYPVEVFSNGQLPSVDGKAPVIYGSTTESAQFVERKGLIIDASDHVEFKKNQTMIRMIESFDVIQTDPDASLYGLLDLGEDTP